MIAIFTVTDESSKIRLIGSSVNSRILTSRHLEGSNCLKCISYTKVRIRVTNMAVAPITKALPFGFHIRKATFADFKEVRKVSQNAYDGFDDIPSLFNIWLQNKRTYLYVLIHTDHVVSLNKLLHY